MYSYTLLALLPLLCSANDVAPPISTFVSANPSAKPFATISEFGTPGSPTPSARIGGAVRPAFSGNLTAPQNQALAAADIFQDTGRFGPEIELVHLCEQLSSVMTTSEN